MNDRFIVTEQSVLRFRPGTRLKEDAVRGQWVVLAPERMFVLDDIGLAVMQSVDGEASVATVINRLAQRFDAERGVIAGDVLEMFQRFSDLRVLSA